MLADGLALTLVYGVPMPFYARYNGSVYYFPATNRYIMVINEHREKRIEVYEYKEGSRVFNIEDAAREGLQITKEEFWMNYNEVFMYHQKVAHEHWKYMNYETKQEPKIEPIDTDMPF